MEVRRATQRSNSELIIALCERVGGGKQPDALSVVKEQVAIRRALEQANPRNAALPAPAALTTAIPTAESEASGLPKWLRDLLPLAPMVADAAIKLSAKGDLAAADEMRRNVAPYAQMLGAMGGAAPNANSVPAVIATSPVDDRDTDQVFEAATPTKALRQVLAHLEDDEAAAFERYWCGMDDDERAKLERQADKVRDLEGRTTWIRDLLRGRATPAQPFDSGEPVQHQVPPALLPVLVQLPPEEQTAGVALLADLDLATIERLVARLVAMPTEGALAAVRRMLATARDRRASHAQRAVANVLSDFEAKGGLS